MKKTRLVKYMFLFTLVSLIAIQNFAAIVSDNDGSAFVTKDEFDLLKVNFNKQINDYHMSIENKIDGAITSYLAGIKFSTIDEYYVFNHNWEYLTCMNYSFQNEYKSIDWDLNMTSLGHSFDGGSGKCTNYAWYHAKSKNDLKNVKQKRILVDAGTERMKSSYNTASTKVVWDGISTNLHETMALSETWQHEKDSSGADYYENLATGYLHPVYVFNFAQKDYIPELYVKANEFWKPNFHYYRSGTSDGDNTITLMTTFTCSTGIELKEVGGKKRTYEHIINYDNITFDHPTDIDWLHTINYDESTTNDTIPKKKATLDSLEAVATKGGKKVFGYVAYGTSYGGNIDKEVSQAYVGQYNKTTDNDKHLPCIGLLDKYFDSKHIEQYSDENMPSIKIVNDTYTPTEPDTLYTGYCVGAGNIDQEFKWEPRFINALAYSKTDGTLKYADFEVNVQLSYEPYVTVATNSDITKVLMNNESTKLFETTKYGRVVFDVPLKKSGLIYCKWWPADNNIRDNYYWEATLDLVNSKNYVLINTD